MVSFRNVPPCCNSWKSKDHSIPCSPDGSVFSGIQQRAGSLFIGTVLVLVSAESSLGFPSEPLPMALGANEDSDSSSHAVTDVPRPQGFK